MFDESVDVSTDEKLDRLSRGEDRKRRMGTLYLMYTYAIDNGGDEILLESGRCTMARKEEVEAFFS